MRYYLEVFDRLEKEHKVGQWECGGVHVWPLVKFLLAREIFDYVKQKGLVPLAGAKTTCSMPLPPAPCLTL